MEVDYTNNFGEEYDSLEERYTHLAEVTFKMLDVQTNYEIDVSLVDDETIHQINRDYRHVDRVTDVISFAFNDDKEMTLTAMVFPESKEESSKIDKYVAGHEGFFREVV